eukprot:CAMPEP_0172167688 /NCGR_PEP_ID=MMETSP1050-20130122/9717_1 /TAXON_ID=233186 /ORGANISM="Cryptomonas curvata, Strain CCAP979/52" /LENGTH=93 /DNA_ID=CAMNT_0012838519 /DNA_START=678 /DNA_END=955 /DNA_ORIENTATION=+
MSSVQQGCGSTGTSNVVGSEVLAAGLTDGAARDGTLGNRIAPGCSSACFCRWARSSVLKRPSGAGPLSAGRPPAHTARGAGGSGQLKSTTIWP